MAKLSNYEKDLIEFDKWEKEFRAKERRHDSIMKKIEKALALEKTDYEAAIKQYKHLCTFEIVTTHPYDRLAIHYRKLKDYDNEINICQLAISKMLADEDDWNKPVVRFEERIKKAMILKEKAK